MTVPYYYRSIDFERLVRDYPPSKDYAETVFLHDRKQIEEVQNRRLLEILDWAAQNPFYRKKWAAHGVRRQDITSKDDLTRLPMVAVEDFKESIKTHPPFGEHPGLTRADGARTPIKLQSSGGTTGMPRPTLFTPLEWEIQGIRARGRCGSRARGPATSCRFRRRSPRRTSAGSIT